MNKRFAVAIVAAVVGALVYFGTYTVKETELVIVTQFGKPARITDTSGLHFKLPGFFENLNRFDKRSGLFETQQTQLLLGDKKPIIISCFVLWKIDDPLLFFQSVGHTENAVQRIGDIINSKLSIILADYRIDNVINVEKEKVLLDEIESRITAAGNENSIKKYGVEIVKTGVQRLAYPKVVIGAVYDRMRSERAKEAEKIRAEGMEVAQKTTIEADKKAREIRAEAQKKALILKGEGDRDAMMIYNKAYAEGGEFFNFVKSLETYQQILGKDTTLVISTDSPLFKYLNLDEEKEK